MKFYYPEGGAPSSDNVELCNAASHIAARSSLAHEAEALIEFDAAVGVPETLMNGDLTLVADDGECATYVETEELIREAEERLPCLDPWGTH